MFQLNENSMKRIMREEYLKRLKQYLNEKMDIFFKVGSQEINALENAQDLKVTHDETGLVFIFKKYNPADKTVVLRCPEESRFDFDSKIKSTRLVSEVDRDNNGVDDKFEINLDKIDSLINDKETIAKRKSTTQKMKLGDHNKTDDEKNTNKNYIIVPLDKFIQEYSL